MTIEATHHTVCPHGVKLVIVVVSERVGGLVQSRIEQSYCPRCVADALIASLVEAVTNRRGQ